MTSETLPPLVTRFIEAQDDRERARILLRLPDTVLLSYRETFEEACHRAGHRAGLDFIWVRLAALSEVRDGEGLLPAATAVELSRMRRALAAWPNEEASA